MTQIKLGNLLVVILTLSATGCLKDSEIELPEVEDVMTLNLILSPHEQPLAYLTNSIALGSEIPIYDIRNASINLYADDKLAGSMVSEEFTDMYGFSRTGYKLPHMISPEVNLFTIKIEAPGFTDIEARTMAIRRSSSSETIRMDSISIVNHDATYHDNLGHFTLGFRDDDPAANFYHVVVYSEALRKDEVSGEWVPHSPERPVSFSRSDLNLEDEIISDDRHGYLLWSTLSGILINDELFNTQYYTIKSKTLLPSGGPSGPDGLPMDHRYLVTMFAEIRSVNEDYYKYYRTLTLQEDNLNNPFAEPVIIHSNVENGLGNMGYYTSVTSDTIYAEY